MSLLDPSRRKVEKQFSNQALPQTPAAFSMQMPDNQVPAQNMAPQLPQNQSTQFSLVPYTGPMKPRTTGQLADLTLSPVTTGQLDEPNINVAQSKTGNLREPVIIRGDLPRSTDPLPSMPRYKRRLLVHLVVSGFLVFSVVLALVAFSPLSLGGIEQAFRAGSNAQQMKGSNSSLLSQQRAAATVVMMDGYDAGTNDGLNPYVPVPPAWAQADPHLSRFYYGQCTFWANYRYHILTGVWVPWLGNAAEWRDQAIAYGWNVSSTPHVPSIIVLQPYVQLAGYYGHVAVVESINGDGTVTTTNWNWAGSGASTVEVNFSYPDPGVSFIWAPNE